MRIAPIVPVFVLIAVAGPAPGDDQPTDRDPWTGFGVGSWIVETESQTRDGKAIAERVKRTRVPAAFGKTIELRSVKQGKLPDVFDGEESTSWHIPGFDPALDPKAKAGDTSMKDLEIRGKKYSCEVMAYTLTEGATTLTVTYWRCKAAAVPYRELPGPPRSIAVRPDVVRVDVDYRGKGVSQKSSVRVANLAEERTVAGKKLLCVRELGEIEIEEDGMKGKGTITRFLSNDVPGREVESVVEADFGGAKIRQQNIIDAFEVVKMK